MRNKIIQSVCELLVGGKKEKRNGDSKSEQTRYY